MTNKGFLKNGNNTILPITRAELVLDANGDVALQSDKFAAVYDGTNPTKNKYGLMSPYDKKYVDELSKVLNNTETLENNYILSTYKGNLNQLFLYTGSSYTKKEFKNESGLVIKINYYPKAGITSVGTDGVMELGHILDFHIPCSNTEEDIKKTSELDYAVRMYVYKEDNGNSTYALDSADGLCITGTTKGNFKGNIAGIADEAKKVTNRLTVQFDGVLKCLYDGSNGYELNITPENINAAEKSAINTKVYVGESNTTSLVLDRGVTVLGVYSKKCTSIKLCNSSSKYINLWMILFTAGESTELPNTCTYEVVSDKSTHSAAIKWAFGESPTFTRGKLYEIIFTLIGNGGNVTASWVRYE